MLSGHPGEVTIHFNNQDAGVVHNIQFFSPSGASVGATALVAGPSLDALTFTVGAGTYAYKCDVHPGTMRGRLIVS